MPAYQLNINGQKDSNQTDYSNQQIHVQMK